MKEIISVLKELPPGLSDAMAQEIIATPLNWQRNAYTGYTSSGYETVSLINPCGDDGDVIIRDTASTRSTAALKALPSIERFLDESGLNIMWARLNKLSPHCCFWEHRDYSELQMRDRYRLHVPIITSPESRLIFEKNAVHLSTDRLWTLRPDRHAHGFRNGNTTRIHLIIDCYGSPALDKLLDKAVLPRTGIMPLKPANPAHYETLLFTAMEHYGRGFKRQAEASLLQTFLEYAQPTGFSHDLTIELYKRLNLPEQVERCLIRKHRYLHQEQLHLVEQEFTEASIDMGAL